MANPFNMREIYDGYLKLANEGKLRNPDGSHNRGGSARCAFWSGYDGIKPAWIPVGSQNYAAWRAGKAYRKQVNAENV
jgi:hypothetical protein